MSEEPSREIANAAPTGPIRGVVAALLSERELVINRGAADGVESGMKFRVLTKNDVEVTDPETGQSLGNIVRVKVRVQITSVQERMSVGRTYELRRSALFGNLPNLGPSEVRTLRTGDSGFLPPIDEKESYVRVGDPVEEIATE